jgi:hypothetical protein
MQYCWMADELLTGLRMLLVRTVLSSCKQVVAMNEYRPAIRFFLLAFAVVAVAGCGTHSRFASQLATPTGPIAVEATVDGQGEIATSLDGNVPKVTLRFGDHRQVVVEQERILVDGEIYPGLPAGTQKVEIDVADGKVTLKVDEMPLTK